MRPIITSPVSPSRSTSFSGAIPTTASMATSPITASPLPAGRSTSPTTASTSPSSKITSTPSTVSNSTAAATNTHMAPVVDNVLAGLITRLEKVTVALEGMASPSSSIHSSSTAPASTTTNTNESAASSPPLTKSLSRSPSLSQFAILMSPDNTPFFATSAQIGGVVAEVGDRFLLAFTALGELIALASRTKKPSGPEALQPFLTSLQSAINGVITFREANRKSEFANHLSVVAEGCPALGWVLVEPAPCPFIGEMRDSAQFYANRVIKEYKEKDKLHFEWAQSFIALLTALQSYVKQHHTTGLTWLRGDAPGAPASAVTAPATSTTAAPKPASTGLFSDIGAGSSVTSGLRKVHAAEKTHKNADLRAGSVVKGSAVSGSASNLSNAAPKGLPKFALEGNKWCIENQVNMSDLVVDKAELRHTVYIYNCVGSTISITSKVTAVTMDNSKKCGLLVDSVVSTVDVINCKSAQIQITGKAPTLLIDKTDGAQLFLSPTSMDVEILTAKSSEVNVSLPLDADYVEVAVPEQLRTKVVGGKLVSAPVDHKS